MKPRNAKDLRELTDTELMRLLQESQETLVKQRFLKILRKDIARINTILTERRNAKN